MMLTGRAALLAVIGGAVVVVVPTGLALLAVNALLLAAIVVDIGLAARVADVQVTRSGDVRIRLGEPGTVEVQLANAGRRTLRGQVRDAWRPSAAASPSRARIDLRPGGRAVLTTTLTPWRRGDTAAGPVTIRSLGPLGLAGRQRNRAAPLTVRVLPPFLSRKHLPEKLARLRELEGQHRSLLRGQGTEFDSLRTYVLGDDIRSIDWRSSARQADVLVRTWRPERDRRIVIVLDTGRTSAGRVGDITRLDASMDAALLLAALAVRAGDRVDLIACDRRVRAQVVRAGRDSVLAAFSDAMAPLEPDLIEPDIGVMAAAVLSVTRQRCLVVLLTDLNPAAIEEGLLPHIRLLSSRHQVLLAAVADPKVAAMAAGAGAAAGGTGSEGGARSAGRARSAGGASALRDAATAVYQAAAAVRAQAERARVGALLRRHGVEIVDAAPDELPPALADAYLTLKAAGRL